MRYTQLRSFHAVALSGSVTAAAQEMNISQPTLTTQIRALEEMYAVELFMRTGGRLQLTQAGHELFRITQRMFADEAEARSFLKESQELKTGHLRMGAVGPFHATEMLVAFHARYPGVQISVSAGNSKSVLQNLLDFRTDVAVLAYVEKDSRLWVRQYSEDPIVVFGRKDHPVMKKRRNGVMIEELHEMPMVLREHGSNTRRASDVAFAKAGVKPKLIMEIGSREAVREAVASGVGLGMVSLAEYVADPRIIWKPVLNAQIFNYAHIVCMRERLHTRLIAAFLGVAKSLRP
jgi:LysR family transcriptional regulator, low CO2-responsive transcriptional regulator